MTKKGLRSRLSRYGDEEFALFLRRGFLKGAGYTDDALERPIDVKFGPDDRLYILDFGTLQVKTGKEHVQSGTGKILVLEPEPLPEAPTTSAAGASRSAWPLSLPSCGRPSSPHDCRGSRPRR